VSTRELFINEWESASWRRRAAGLVKKLLSSRRIGPYGVARHIYFVAQRVRLMCHE
jgi:hypothetical protein